MLTLETLARLVHCQITSGNPDRNCPRALESLREWARKNPCCAEDLEPVSKAEKRAAAEAEHKAEERAKLDALTAAVKAEAETLRAAILDGAKAEAQKIIAEALAAAKSAPAA